MTTVTQLITDAYYLSGRLSRGLQTISGQQLSQGLRLLNALLAIKSANDRLIPYFTEYQFNAIVNEEKYFISKLISVETLTFELNSVRFSMTQLQRRAYQGTSRANNVSSLMYNFVVERAKGGANIFMYFLPDSTYTLTLWGKFSLSSVVLNQDLSSTLDDYYIEYLRYALAEYICQDNNITFQPQNYERLEELESLLIDVSPPDLTISKLTPYGKGTIVNYGDINIGHGWRPG